MSRPTVSSAASSSTAVNRGRAAVPAPRVTVKTVDELLFQMYKLALAHDKRAEAEQESEAAMRRLEAAITGVPLSADSDSQQLSASQSLRREHSEEINAEGDLNNCLPASVAIMHSYTSPTPSSSTFPAPPSAASPSLPARSSPASTVTSRRNALEARKANLQALAAKLESDQTTLQSLRAAVHHKREALLPKTQFLQQLQTSALSQRTALSLAQKKLRTELRVELDLARLKCAFRRRTLLQHLSAIYPISPPRQALKTNQNNMLLMCYTIRGLRLPNNFNNILTSFDDEQVSTALGYVCHLLTMLSKYLEVPLRYRMIYRGSRSVICDDVTASSQFPLYFKNMEERRFELGVILLNKNIEQMLNVRLDPSSMYAKHVRELTCTLENLDLLMKYEIPQ